MNTILRMVNISKSFPGVKALEDVDLQIMKGEVLVLLGENGAGKSTLMKILSGIYSPGRGKIVLDGNEVAFKSPRDATRAGISMIYQELNLVPTQTVAQNILVGREPRVKGLPFLIDLRAMRDAARPILESVGLDLDPQVMVSQLSVAHQQMVAIAKAISSEAKIIIMDEPTATLTEKEIDRLFAIIKKLKGDGLSIVYISHRLQEVHRIGDRCAVLRDGRVVGNVELARVTVEELIRMMIGEEGVREVKREKPGPGEEVLRIEELPGTSGRRDRTIRICSGEIVGLAGVVGSGRTELAQTVFGIGKLEYSRVYLDSRPVVIKSPHRAIQRGVALLPEDRRTCGLFLRLSYRENAVSAAHRILSRFGITRPALEKKQAIRYQRELNIDTPGLNQVVRLLSGGNQQKTVIAKWLCSQARVFIFDDPTRGVDVGARREVHQLMNELTGQGAAILMISSDLSELLSMSDRIYVMNKGRIVTELDRQDATHEKVFQYATQQI
jgi:ribose transport system ATP-binding protein